MTVTEEPIAPSQIFSPGEEMPDLDAPADAEFKCQRCDKVFKNKAGLSGHKLFCSGKKEDPKAPRTAGEGRPNVRTPTLRTKRHDASGLLGSLWGGVARFVPSPAAGRAMSWQAPGAGLVLDKALAGSFVDKHVIQKVAGGSDKYKPAASLVGLPVMVMLLEKNRALLPVLYAPLRACLADNLEAALDAKAADMAKQDRIAEKAAAVGFELETEDADGHKVDVIDAIISEILGSDAEE